MNSDEMNSANPPFRNMVPNPVSSDHEGGISVDGTGTPSYDFGSFNAGTFASPMDIPPNPTFWSLSFEEAHDHDSDWTTFRQTTMSSTQDDYSESSFQRTQSLGTTDKNTTMEDGNFDSPSVAEDQALQAGNPPGSAEVNLQEANPVLSGTFAEELPDGIRVEGQYK